MEEIYVMQENLSVKNVQSMNIANFITNKKKARPQIGLVVGVLELVELEKSLLNVQSSPAEFLKSLVDVIVQDGNTQVDFICIFAFVL